MRLYYTLLIMILAGCGSDKSSDSFDPATNPYYSKAWHLHNTKDANVDSKAHVNISKAWQKSRGKGVRVAVLDDYFNPSHPDIKDRVVLTYNASDNSSNINTLAGKVAHGQRVAGVLAASTNSIGSTGVAPEIELILIGSAYEDDASQIRAFEYAKEHGAQVVNCSWGSYAVSQAVVDTIKDLYDANITIVFASGNGGFNLDQTSYNDESELEWVIGVSSSSEFNTRTTDADYGSNIDILAPGGEKLGIVTTDNTNYTTNFRGTSAATPIVSGAVAIMLSLDPNLTPEQIRERIINNADKIGNIEYIDGFNLKYAYGKINISKSVLE